MTSATWLYAPRKSRFYHMAGADPPILKERLAAAGGHICCLHVSLSHNSVRGIQIKNCFELFLHGSMELIVGLECDLTQATC